MTRCECRREPHTGGCKRDAMFAVIHTHRFLFWTWRTVTHACDWCYFTDDMIGPKLIVPLVEPLGSRWKP